MSGLRILEAQRPQLDSCAYCPKLCRFTCPVSEATGREAFTPWGKMSTAFLVATRARPPDAALATAAYACSGCGSCGAFCRNHVVVPEALAGARAVVVESGLAPPGIQALLDRFRRDDRKAALGRQPRAGQAYFVTVMSPTMPAQSWSEQRSLNEPACLATK